MHFLNWNRLNHRNFIRSDHIKTIQEKQKTIKVRKRKRDNNKIKKCIVYNYLNKYYKYIKFVCVCVEGSKSSKYIK